MMAQIFRVDFKQNALVAVTSDAKRDNLPIGTVLETEGYGTEYVVVENMGSNTYEDGVCYKIINLETYAQSRQEAAPLKWLKEKEDSRIQTYITDKVMTLDEVEQVKTKSEQLRTEAKAKAAKEDAEDKRLMDIGRILFNRYIPTDAKALIIAEQHADECDPMSDYYSHKVVETVIIGYSKHIRDLFSEMRKAAEKYEETKHLGVGKGHFSPYVAIGQTFNTQGRYQHEGQRSPWHHELDKDESGCDFVFSTREDAESLIQSKGQPENITCDGQDIPFIWKIEETNIEHREKWSMGAGYYLKDGCRDSSGWCVRKVPQYGNKWDEKYFISIARRCIFTDSTTPKNNNPK